MNQTKTEYTNTFCSKCDQRLKIENDKNNFEFICKCRTEKINDQNKQEFENTNDYFLKAKCSKCLLTLSITINFKTSEVYLSCNCKEQTIYFDNHQTYKNSKNAIKDISKRIYRATNEKETYQYVSNLILYEDGSVYVRYENDIL